MSTFIFFDMNWRANGTPKIWQRGHNNRRLGENLIMAKIIELAEEQFESTYANDVDTTP